jgi:hypothetical protein
VPQSRRGQRKQRERPAKQTVAIEKKAMNEHRLRYKFEPAKEIKRLKAELEEIL